ncbi:MAG: hypothetical protein J6Q60_01060 [Bacteroidaceae bacterium]|nr:hypothetical protein [Bacteroidaceae bacterium]
MAKANWVKVNPSQGSGNATVNVSSNGEHTGRVARTTILTWKAANVADIQRTVNQAGKPEYVDIEDAASADKAGKVVTISGVSNSKKLTFSFGTGNLTDIVLPSTYMANSVSTSNGANINGDPGAAAEYNFSISITVPANDDITAKTRQIIVTDEAGHQDVCTLTSAAGDAYVTIAEGDIELDYQGTPVAVEVKSNTTWTIE